MKLPLNGGCRCDSVRIRVSGPPVMTAACHCSGCQRMSSSAFSLTAMCQVFEFSVTKGEPALGGLHRPELRHFFCAHCMTWMFSRPVQLPQIVNVRPSMFDDHAWFAPFIETYAKAKLPWAHTGAQHSFQEFPPMDAIDGLLKEFAEWRGNGVR
jgi:hypothetical protein